LTLTVLWYEPAKQAPAHTTLLPAADIKPSPQVVQVSVAATDLCVPAGQILHSDLSVEGALPNGQGIQVSMVLAPTVGEYVPEFKGQSVQGRTRPSMLYLPAGQYMQVVGSEFGIYVPGIHCLRHPVILVASIDSLYFPVGQSTQSPPVTYLCVGQYVAVLEEKASSYNCRVLRAL
jgi:hypothetical protein